MIRFLPIAYRNLTRNRRRTLFTFSAIAVGTAMLIFLDGVNHGVMNMLMEGFIESRVGTLQIHKTGYIAEARVGRLLHLNFAWDEPLKAKILAVPGVSAVTGRIAFAGMLNNGAAQSTITAVAVDPATEYLVCPHFKTVLSPGVDVFGPSDKDHVIMTAELAKGLAEEGSEPGKGLETMTLVATSAEGRHNSLDVHLHGFAVNMMPGPLPRRMITVPLGLAQQLLGMEGRVTEVAIQVDDLARLDEVKAALRAALPTEYEVHDWRELVPEIADISFRQMVILGIVSSLLLALVVFGIVNTMLMCVRERIREIGTMAAIGTQPSQVLAIFTSEAVMLGLLGGILGAGLGLALTFFFFKVGIPLPSGSPLFAKGIRPVGDVAYAGYLVMGALGVSFFAGLFPAWRATTLKPVDALAVH